MADLEEPVSAQEPEAKSDAFVAEHAKLDEIGFAPVAFAKPDNSPDDVHNARLEVMSPGTFVVLASGDTLVRAFDSNRFLATFADLRGSGEVHAQLAGIGYQPAPEDVRRHVQEAFDSGSAQGSIPVMEAEYVAAEDVRRLEA